MLLTASLTAALLAAPSSAPVAAWGEGGCDMLVGTAASQSASLVAPTLFAETGFVNAGETPVLRPDLPTGGPTYRVMVGASYSLGRLFQGLALRSRAEAACRRERARTGLEAALAVGDALDADRVRYEDLRALHSETTLALARASNVPHPTLADVPTLLAQYEALDRELGLAEERVRGGGSWDLAVRGGYDHLTDGRDRVPFFALLSASYDLGRLFRSSADARALAGRARAEHESADALPVRVARLLDARRATLAAERARLRSSETLLAALDGQMAQLERLETSKIDRFRHTLWFELVRTRAERAYLAAHVEDLARALEQKE